MDLKSTEVTGKETGLPFEPVQQFLSLSKPIIFFKCNLCEQNLKNDFKSPENFS